MGSDAGNFLGIERPDWGLLTATQPQNTTSAYGVTAEATSITCGRLSFVLGLHGPCLSIDAACASALTALHGAAQAVRNAECGSAIAAATSLKLLPLTTLGAAAAGMLSVDGRCKTWDVRANGYARAEGVGTCLALPADAPAACFARPTPRADCVDDACRVLKPGGAALDRFIEWDGGTTIKEDCYRSEEHTSELQSP